MQQTTGGTKALLRFEFRFVVAHATIDHERPKGQQRRDEDGRRASDRPARDEQRPQQREAEDDEENIVRSAKDLHGKRLASEIL